MAWCIYLVRQRESAAAALFGAVCFLISPALLQKLITAEPDVMLSTLLFATFIVWWDGQKTGRVTYARWLATGAVLAAAALTKGPQPVAYFTLGVGAFLLLKRQWKDLPGFLIANAMAGLMLLAWYVSIYKPGNWAIWAAHSRLHTGIRLSDYLLGLFHFIAQFALELLPGTIVAVPFVLTLAKKRELMRDDLALALLLYASLCTLVLVLWPGSGTRYAMPAILAVAALAGLGYARVRAEHPRWLDGGIGVAFVLAVYAIAIGWIAMPLKPTLFAGSRIGAEKMTAPMGPNPAPLYCIFEFAQQQCRGLFAGAHSRGDGGGFRQARHAGMGLYFGGGSRAGAYTAARFVGRAERCRAFRDGRGFVPDAAQIKRQP